MEHEDAVQILRRAKKQKRDFSFTFMNTPDAARAAAFLLSYAGKMGFPRKIVSISEKSKQTLMRAMQYGKWDPKDDRSIPITLQPSFDVDRDAKQFLQQLLPHIESMDTT